MEYHNGLQEYTGYESGAVVYEDGSVWIGSWSSIFGVPREFATGTIALAGDLDGDDLELLPHSETTVPQSAIDAMRAYECEQKSEISEDDDFAAIEIPSAKIVVVTARGWV